MKIVAGLGNPGRGYSETRHNSGFLVADELARRWGLTDWRRRFDALVAEHNDRERILLVKPQTFMNLSGTAVGALARWYKIPAADITVIFDDLDLPPGTIRLRGKGGSGGHRGIESVLVQLGTDRFIRLRLGIGHPPAGWEGVDYVLGRFAADEAPLIRAAVIRAADAVECLLAEGLDQAMNRFNR